MGWWNLWSPTANHPQIQVKAPGWRNCRSLHHRWVAMWRYKTLPFAIRSKLSKPMDLSFQTDFLALSAWCSCGWCWVSFSNKKVLQMGSWSKNSKVLKSGRWEKPKTELNTSTAKMQFRVWVPDFYSIFQGKPRLWRMAHKCSKSRPSATKPASSTELHVFCDRSGPWPNTATKTVNVQ